MSNRIMEIRGSAWSGGVITRSPRLTLHITSKVPLHVLMNDTISERMDSDFPCEPKHSYYHLNAKFLKWWKENVGWS